MFRRSLLLLFILSVGSGNVHGTWEIIKQFSIPVSSGFFWNRDVGLIGLGVFGSDQPLAIYRTSDGGNTWVPSMVPAGVGRITSIFMVDSSIGYASVMRGQYTKNSQNTIWKTIDAGVSWQDFTQNNLGGATCVYATSRAIIFTSWNLVGGSSTDNGATYRSFFQGGKTDYSNGIDFLDDLHGVVTMGPNNGGLGSVVNTYTTSDGGVIWSLGGTMRESWGIYAQKNSGMYFSMAEDIGTNGGGEILYYSTNNGQTWVPRFNFAPTYIHFTGHIEGANNAIYIQTDLASRLFRSDDQGLTWKDVGGPSHNRDTRFCVTGCNGETVYAFDKNGGVWKTTDGGDGTLFGGDSTQPSLSLAYDSIAITSHYCEPVLFGFPLINGSCSEFIIDSILVTNPSGKFVLLDSPSTISSSHTDSLRLQFQSDRNEVQIITIRLKGRGNGKTYDTLLTATVTNISNGIFGPLLSLQSNSIDIRTHYCQSGEITIPLQNVNCSVMKIDTLYLLDPLNESLISYRPKGDTIAILSEDSIKLQFRTNTNESRTIPLHLKCSIAGRTFDTIITLNAFHSRSPEPYLDLPKPTKVGDTVSVALHMLPPTDTINIKHLAFHLSYNGDLLTPVAGKIFETGGTLTEHNKNLSGREVSPGNLDCRLDLDNDSIYNKSDFTKPVIYIRFRVTLTTEFSCPIFIDSFSIVGVTPLGLCDIPSTTFEIIPECGDSTIWSYMRTGIVPQIISIRPNPAKDKIQIEFNPAGRSSAKLQIVSALGRIVKAIDLSKESIGSFSIETSALPSGIYYMRIVTEDGSVCSKGFSVEH